ncbi:phospho-sugar glycosidase domain-containing protein, partial [Staphylococcus saprophyticus]|uniref:phospho-sugar glycosidase domain-containing protein n=1 Tax=Staphylococcus saprophyticus TaxID=29385 RepID=UPI00119C9447
GKRGGITVENEVNGGYEGEVEIMKRDLQGEEDINVVGEIIEDDIGVIDCLGGNDRFEFIIETRS